MQIPYSRQWIDEVDIEAVVEVLRSDFLTQGPAVEAFEEAFAQVHGVAHAVAHCNATAALHTACIALGVGPGDWVWTAPNSFVASANCALYCGAGVDFVDIDPVTRNMSTTALAEKLEAAKEAGRLPKVVIPVDFSGLPVDLSEMRQLADRFGFAIIEDASHAVGATYKGRPIGGQYADITVFSFHPVKIVTTAEGGMCTTQDDELAHRLRLLRSHGITRNSADMTAPSEGGWYYQQVTLGFNYRLTDLQAALGRSQLMRLPELHAAREARARRYDTLLERLPLHLPARLNDRTSAHHLYVIGVDETATKASRAQIFANLREAGVAANVHYIPIHLQPHYRAMGFNEGDFPAAEAYYRGAITIPLFPAMSDAQQDYVVEKLKRALEA